MQYLAQIPFLRNEKVQRITMFWKRVFIVFAAARPGRLAAALSYYAIFSIVPLLVIMFSVLGLFIDPSVIAEDVFACIALYVGTDGAMFLRDAMLHFAAGSTESILAVTLSVGALVFASLGAFSELQDGLSSMWEYTRARSGIRGFVLQKAFSLIAVVLIGVLILAVFVGSTVISLFGSLVTPSSASLFTLTFFNQLLSAVFMTALFVLMFRMLPWAHVSWRSAVVGAVVSALLFIVGRSVLMYYVEVSTAITAFGQAGTLIVILLWVYYSGFIIYFGAAIARVVGEVRKGELPKR